MKLSEIYKIADELAPKALSDEMCAKYGWYDNSGVLVDVGEDIEKILFSLDLSTAAVDEAIEKKVNLVITHHPAVYGKISTIDYHDESLLGNKLIRCIRAGISVIAMHLNLDSAEGGIDESLMEGIARSTGAGTRLLATQLPLNGGGYGRVYEIIPTPLGELTGAMKATFASERVELYGDTKKSVKRVASFCGSGADEKAIAFARASGAEVMVSSDFKHHVLSLALETGLSVITLTHYASENYSFKKYYEKISRQVEIPCIYHEDNELL